MRITPTPFDPDSLAPARGWTGDVVSNENTEGMMLSDLVKHLGEPETTTRSEGPGTSAPLDKNAKWKLSELAEATFNQLRRNGELAGEKLEGFRRRIAIAACGRRISQACHGDRMLIQSAFLKLKGAVRQAAQAQAKAATTALDIALYKLSEAVKQTGLSESYAEGISRRIYKRPICALTSSKEVWTIIFTIKNNANAAAGKGQPSNRFKSLRAKRQTSKQTKSL
jgi:hypothetical protein